MTGAGSVASGRGSLAELLAAQRQFGLPCARDSSREQFNSFIRLDPNGSGLQQNARASTKLACNRAGKRRKLATALNLCPLPRSGSRCYAIGRPERNPIVRIRRRRRRRFIQPPFATAFFRFKWHDNRTRRLFLTLGTLSVFIFMLKPA